MNYRLIINFLLLALCVLTFNACDDDDDKEISIVGSWEGTEAEFEFTPEGSPVPLEQTDDDFDATLVFLENKTMTIDYNSEQASGNYERSGNNLEANIDFELLFVELSGDYNIDKLTETELIISTERDGEFEYPPGSGNTLEGNAKVTLHFTKMP